MRSNPIVIQALAVIILFSSSCKKSSYSSSTGGLIGATDWNWTGTAPLSAEIDGIPYQATMTSGAKDLNHLFGFTATNSSDIIFEVDFNKMPTANAVYGYDSSDSSADFGFIVNPNAPTYSYSIRPGTGQIKVIAITDTTIEGLFYGTVHDNLNVSSGITHTITHGYFKVPRK